MIPFIDLARQNRILSSKIDAAIRRVLDHGKYILGPEVGELEAALARYSGSKYCITCANGTDGLQIALMALGVGPGDEVVMPAFGYIAAAEVTALLGAKPVYVDIRPDTFNLNVEQLAAAISDRTKVIVPISLFGQCANMEAINMVAAQSGVSVVEDAAQSFGASFRGKKSCNLSSIGVTSFFPSKPLGCYGDGGAIFTSDEALATEIRKIARHGQSRRYFHDVIGVNSRLDTIQAAVLLQKLIIFEDELQARSRVAATYSRLLNDGFGGSSEFAGIKLPFVEKGCSSVWAQYTIRTKDRNELRAALEELGIPTVIYYPLPLNEQEAVRDMKVNMEESHLASQEVVSLPMHPYLSDQHQKFIVDAIVSVCRT